MSQTKQQVNSTQILKKSMIVQSAGYSARLSLDLRQLLVFRVQPQLQIDGPPLRLRAARGRAFEFARHLAQFGLQGLAHSFFGVRRFEREGLLRAQLVVREALGGEGRRLLFGLEKKVSMYRLAWKGKASENRLICTGSASLFELQTQGSESHFGLKARGCESCLAWETRASE